VEIRIHVREGFFSFPKIFLGTFENAAPGFTFLVLAHTGSPGQRAIKRLCVCVCVCVVTTCLKSASNLNAPPPVAHMLFAKLGKFLAFAMSMNACISLVGNLMK